MWGDAESDPDFRREVLARLHITARVRICRNYCSICARLPRDRPTATSTDNNILLEMRAAAVQQELVREALSPMVSRTEGGPSPRMPRRRSSLEQPRPVCPVPPVAGILWAAVQRLVAHAWQQGADVSLCGKRPTSLADWQRDYAPNWCRECQVAVLRQLGRDVYVAGNEIREHTLTGSRKLARSERIR